MSTFRKVLKLEPEFTAAWIWIVYVLALQKKYSEVTSAVEQLAKQGLRDTFTEFCAFFESGLNQKNAAETTVLSEEARSYFWNGAVGVVVADVARGQLLQSCRQDTDLHELRLERSWHYIPPWVPVGGLNYP